MTDKSEKKTPAKKAAAKPEKANPEAKAAPRAQAKEKPAQEKKSAPKAGGTVTLRQVGSPIGRQGYQRATLIGLGLNKLQRTRTLEDTPSVRGMIAKVKHLVEIVE